MSQCVTVSDIDIPTHGVTFKYKISTTVNSSMVGFILFLSTQPLADSVMKNMGHYIIFQRIFILRQRQMCPIPHIDTLPPSHNDAVSQHCLGRKLLVVWGVSWWCHLVNIPMANICEQM